MNKIHIGSIVQQKFRNSRISVNEFAAAINCSKKNVYDIFRRETIQLDKLQLICNVLNLDISDCFCQPSPKANEEKTGNSRYVAIIETTDRSKLDRIIATYNLTCIKSWEAN